MNSYYEQYFEKYQQYRLPGFEFVQDKKVGSGSFGKVYKATYNGANPAIGREVAIKQFANQDFFSEMKNYLYLRKKNIPNITHFHGYYLKSKLHIVLELCDFTLAKLIQQINCNLQIARAYSWKSRMDGGNYFIEEDFWEGDSLFYQHSSNSSAEKIPITREQHELLKQLYDSKPYAESKLTRLDLLKIKEITGHTPNRMDGLYPHEIQDLLLQFYALMMYLESINFVHTDIKPHNILVNRRDGKVEFKLCDFGLSFLEKNAPTGGFGSPLFMAPEVLAENHMERKLRDLNSNCKSIKIVNSTKSDAYSQAMVTWCLLVGEREIPYDKMLHDDFFTELHDHVCVQNKREDIPENYLHKTLESLIRENWERDPAKRPTAKENYHKLQNHYAELQKDKENQPVNPADSTTDTIPQVRTPLLIFGHFNDRNKAVQSELSSSPTPDF